MADEQRIERFRAMYDAGYPKMVAFVVRRARNRDDTDDIVGDIFMTAWRRLDDAPTEELWNAWLYGIAKRVLSNHYRSIDRRRRLTERVGSVAVPVESEAGPTIVNDALGHLAASDREILTLAVWDDLSNDEIGVALGIPPSTVAVRLHRARKRLGRELSRLGYVAPEQMKSEGVSRTPHDMTEESRSDEET